MENVERNEVKISDNVHNVRNPRIILKTVPLDWKFPKAKLEAFDLFDEGSTASLMESALTKKPQRVNISL